jgi:hypothetical protein
MCGFWFFYFYGANLTAPIFGPFSFDSSELPIITIYALYIPIFVFYIIKEGKTGSKFKNIVMPILATITALFMIFVAVYAHGIRPYQSAAAEGKFAFDGAERWEELFTLRDDVMKALEIARAEKKIGKSLDAKVTVYTADAAVLELLGKFTAEELKTVFITSGAHVVNAAAPEGAYAPEEGKIAVLVENADGKRCDRCWCYSTEGESDEEGFICERCKKILETL